MVGQIRQVARPPADNGEAKGHRLAVHRAVRLFDAGQHEDISRRIHRRHLRDVQRSVDHHPRPEGGLSEPSPQAGRVGGLGIVVADQMQRRQRFGQARQRIQQPVDAFALHPVSDAQQARPAAVAQVARSRAGGGSHV